MTDIKVGDYVRGYTGQNRMGPIVGTVVRVDISNAVRIKPASGILHYVFKNTLELLSVPLPLLAPINWAKPVRLKGYPDAKWRVLCTDAPGNAPIRLLLLEGAVNYSPVGSVFHRQKDGTNGDAPSDAQSFENIPPAPMKLKRWVIMTKNGGMVVACSPTREGVIVGHRPVAMCEVELTEGEGMI